MNPRFKKNKSERRSKDTESAALLQNATTLHFFLSEAKLGHATLQTYSINQRKKAAFIREKPLKNSSSEIEKACNNNKTLSYTPETTKDSYSVTVGWLFAVSIMKRKMVLLLQIVSC